MLFQGRFRVDIRFSAFSGQINTNSDIQGSFSAISEQMQGKFRAVFFGAVSEHNFGCRSGLFFLSLKFIAVSFENLFFFILFYFFLQIYSLVYFYLTHIEIIEFALR